MPLIPHTIHTCTHPDPAIVGVMLGTSSTGSTLRVPSIQPSREHPTFSTSAATFSGITTSSTGPIPSFTANSRPSAARTVTTASLAQKGKDAALADLIASGGVSALLRSSEISLAENTKAQEPADTESLSSLPLGLPEDTRYLANSMFSTG